MRPFLSMNLLIMAYLRPENTLYHSIFGIGPSLTVYVACELCFPRPN